MSLEQGPSTGIFESMDIWLNKTRIKQGSKRKKPPPVGLEPTTFELEVQHASPLRHGGGTYYSVVIFHSYMIHLPFCW